jgi:uncharacterized protein
MKPVKVKPPRIRPEVAARLRYYVYAYVDPRNSKIFYVGKGCHGRALVHLDQEGDSAKVRRIVEIKGANKQPRIDILAHGIDSEKIALRIEAAVIDALWPGKTLAYEQSGNKIHGQTFGLGRETLSELEFRYCAKPVTITEPVILIRINKLYRPGMSSEALYEATCGVWTCGIRREDAVYGFAVYQGVVRQVYEIDRWHKGGTHKYRTRPREEVDAPDRCEFSGKVSKHLSAKYKGRSVECYFSQGAQLPYTYVNC